MCILVWES